MKRFKFRNIVSGAMAIGAIACSHLSAAPLPPSFDLGIEAAVNDVYAQGPQTGALYLFGVGGMFGSDSALVFSNNSGRFYSVPGGSVVTGTVAVGVANGTSAANILDASRSFNLSMQFAARAGAGSGGPKLELKPQAYIGGGGSIDSSTWSYWDLTSATLTGTAAFDGITIALTQIPANSEFPFQYGDGASGRTVRSSGSMWFNWVITAAGVDRLLGNVGKSGDGDVYFQSRCANDAATAGSTGLDQCSASVPVPGSLLLLSIGLLGLAWLVRKTRPADQSPGSFHASLP